MSLCNNWPGVGINAIFVNATMISAYKYSKNYRSCITNKGTDNVRVCGMVHSLCSLYSFNVNKTDPPRALTGHEGSIEGVDRRGVTQPVYVTLCTIIHVYPEHQWTLHKVECNTLEVGHDCP